MYERELKKRIEQLMKLGFRIDGLLPNVESQNWWRSFIGTIDENTKREIEKRIEELKEEVMKI